MLNIEIAQKYAQEHNGKCLSKRYKNCYTKLKWKCCNGHIFYMDMTSINQGCWCKKCSKYCNKYTIKDCRLVAKSRNGKCLSKKYKNNYTPLEWKCNVGHIWLATFSDVNRGRWCRLCSIERQKKSIQDARNLAKKHGRKCLSNVYLGAHGKLTWECKKKHTWESEYNSVRKGHWCPHCKRSKGQETLSNILKKIFPNLLIINGFKNFDWLKTNDGKQEIDIYIPKLKLAIEFDGKQHYESIDFFGGKAVFKRQKYLDNIKNKKIKQHPEDIRTFIRFSYKEKLIQEYIVKIIQKKWSNNVPKFKLRTNNKGTT